MGEVSPNYSYIENGEFAVLSKEYTEDDFTVFYYDLGGKLPDIEYRSIIEVN